MSDENSGNTEFSNFIAAQRSRLVKRDLQTYKTGTAADSFHSYDPREKVSAITKHAVVSHHCVIVT